MGILRWLGKFAQDEIFDDLGKKLNETIEDTKLRIEDVTKTVLKTITLWAIMFTGIVFILVGTSLAIQHEFVKFAGGYGFVLVGIFIIIFSLLVKLLK